MSARQGRRGKANAPFAAPSLAELQSAFQDALLIGHDGILAHIPGNGRTTREVLLGVYRHAYKGRLVDVVGHDYERLWSFMGDDAFRQMARVYIDRHPSCHPNVRYFSRALPEFLETSADYAPLKVLADLARLERALNDAFDAADKPVVTVGVLTRYAPEQWAGLAFEAQPSAIRLDLSTNALAIWQALGNEEAPPKLVTRDEPQRLLVWRQDVTPRVREIASEEAMMWDEAAKGVPFGRLCELVAVMDDPETAPLRAAAILNGWISTGALQGVRLVSGKRRVVAR